MLYDPKWEKKIGKRGGRKWTLPELYNAAADAIQERGHSKGLLVRPDGSMCLWGALAFVVEGDARHGDSTLRAIDPLYEFTKGESPIAWNNERTRTKRQVVNLLRKAARILAARRVAGEAPRHD
jgi:hypothetical protein